MPGTRIPEGSSLVLVVGSGLGDSQALVPSLKGLGLEEATQEVLSASLVIGSPEYDVPPSGNEEDYIIYRQRPAAGTSLTTGSRIDIYLTTDKARLKEVIEEEKKKKKEDTDEQFF